MIYFIREGAFGNIKIRYTGNSAEERMASLQTGNSVTLRLLGTVPGEADVETSLHEQFAQWRLQGEWFSPSLSLLSYIASRGIQIDSEKQPDVPASTRPTWHENETTETLLAQFVVIYGCDGPDSFVIESKTGVFLGECGLSSLGDTPVAFELWLYNSRGGIGICTTKVLMSERVYHDNEIRTKLALKGKAELALVGKVVLLKTKATTVKAHITEVEYNEDGTFEALTVEMNIYTLEQRPAIAVVPVMPTIHRLEPPGGSGPVRI